jgi:type IV secretion system protein VirD4
VIRLSRGQYLGLAGAAYVALSIWIASMILLYGSGIADQYRWHFWEWPYFALMYWDDPNWHEWLLISGVLGASGPALVAAGLAWRFRGRWRSIALFLSANRVRPVERGVSDNLGHSDWRSLASTRQLFPGGHPRWGGIAVAEEYRVDLDPKLVGVPFDPRNPRTWGQGGRTPLLLDDAERNSGHSHIFAGSGAYKSTSAVTSILTWTGSSVIFDPSTEFGPMLNDALKRQRKQVFHIGIPDKSKPIQTTGFNALAWIDTSHPEAEPHVHSVAAWLYDEAAASKADKNKDPFFPEMGKMLITCCLAHFLWSGTNPTDITLDNFIQAFDVTEKDMPALLAHIRTSSRSPMARRMATTLMGCQAEETWSGIYLNASNGIKWLYTEAYAEFLSAGEFDPRSLLLGRTTVFLNVSLRTLEDTPAIARVLVGSLLNTVVMADGHTLGRILFLLDEAARLGYLAPLVTARDTGRKYGIVLHCLWQSIGQMAEIYGENGLKAWFDSASWTGYSAIRAGSAGKSLSDELGTYPVLARSEGDNRGRHKPFGLQFGSTSSGTNTNIHEIKRSLMTAAEQQQDLREDEILIVPASGQPIRANRPIYFRRPGIDAQVATPPKRFATLAEQVRG